MEDVTTGSPAIHLLTEMNPQTGQKTAACGILLGGMSGDTKDRRTTTVTGVTCRKCITEIIADAKAKDAQDARVALSAYHAGGDSRPSRRFIEIKGRK